MAFTWLPGHMRKALRRIEADALCAGASDTESLLSLAVTGTL